ncbi:peptide deformylase 1A, chloroplastic isoform X2 [Typha latifolia]|uniref:peptide deformylase 1A, chloroplastic isoform X2 n=1 Tax=Typha latifolia TaxID=4733 RepID=UPI003C30D455
METIHRLFPLSGPKILLGNSKTILRPPRCPTTALHELPIGSRAAEVRRFSNGGQRGSSSRSSRVSAGWFSGFRSKKADLPEIVKAGDPVLHEPAREVCIKEIGSEKIEKIIEDMIAVMRNAPGVGLAAPQIGIPLKFCRLLFWKILRNTSVMPQKMKLKHKIDAPLIFCVDGFRAVVERYLEVEVSGLGRDGRPIKIEASGWQARILQHECDHLDGTLYVDKMMPRTFRTVQNLDLPLPTGIPKLGAQ